MFGGIYLLIYKANHDYGEVITSFKKSLEDDFELYRIRVKEVTTSEADALIDEFEGRWECYVKRTELNYLIGKLIEAQCEREASFS
jgi:hypothetical protein